MQRWMKGNGGQAAGSGVLGQKPGGSQQSAMDGTAGSIEHVVLLGSNTELSHREAAPTAGAVFRKIKDLRRSLLYSSTRKWAADVSLDLTVLSVAAPLHTSSCYVCRITLSIFPAYWQRI